MSGWAAPLGGRKAGDMIAAQIVWRPPPQRCALGDNEVHLWRAALDVPAARLRTLRQTLDADERMRATRYRFQSDRARYIATRGLLRTILSRYLPSEPSTLRFVCNRYGKPFLIGGREAGSLHFNVSHSHGLAIFAVTRAREVGVDLEYIRADVPHERIVDQFFSPEEVRVFSAVPTCARRDAFFACWTRKEAYIKARGMGLSLPVDRFDVSVAPGAPPALLGTREAGEDPARWSLYDLAPGHGYAAALAVAGQTLCLRYWHWPATDEQTRPLGATMRLIGPDERR